MKNLQAATADFLSTPGLVSWEPEHRSHAISVLEAFRDGKLDGAGFRAAVGGGGARNTRAGASTRTTAVLRLYGVLTPDESIFSVLGAGTSLRAFSSELRAAAADPAITSIAVLIDSPGGHVAMTPETAALMRSARSKKPVVGAVFGLNASAAYWISSNATRLEATSSARVGSIGVYSQRVSVARMLEKDGVDIEIFSAGKYKAEGDPSTAITDDERMARQADVDESYANFISDVSFGRGIAASIIRAGFGQGRVVSAPEALRLRMIDSVSLVEDTVARTAAGAFPMPQSATAWANQVERAIFELSLPSAEPTPTSAAMLRQQIELERLEMEIALL